MALSLDIALPPAEGGVLTRAPYTPFMAARTARAPGISPLGTAPLIAVLDDFAWQMARRAALIRARPEIVHALLPEAEPAALELLDTIAETAGALPGFERNGRHWHRPDGITTEIDHAQPLLSLGTMVAEDFCLLSAAPGAQYRLIGAILCFPSRWLLSEKLDKPLTAIHDRVPEYDDTLARRVARLFETLRPGRALVRVNWLVHATPEPHLPLGLSDKLVAKADPQGPLYLRTERQTLLRLPKSGAVAFGIKTSISALDSLTPEEKAALAHALQALDGETIAYRAGADLHQRALQRLTRSGQA